MGRNRTLLVLLFVGMLALILGMGFVIGTFFLGPRTALDTPSAAEVFIANSGKDSFLVPGEAQRRTNPLSALNPDQIANAKKLYTARCVVCHGSDGTGQTTIGQNIHPRAANLTDPQIQGRSDGTLFWFTANGIPHTAMPGWKNVLKEEEMWQLVAYLRLLPKGADAISKLLPTPTPTPTATFTPTALPSPSPTATPKAETPAAAATAPAAPTAAATTVRPAATTAALSSGNVVTATIKDYTFPPVAVSPGTRVVWVNADEDEHDAVADGDTHLFESPLLEQGETYSFVFDKPGTYPYHCTVHDDMHGVVVVK